MSHRLRTILLIDDNPADNFLHSLVIEDADIADEVVTYTSAKAALDYLMSETEDGPPRPDLILLDINMPGMNGWDFLEAYGDLQPQQRGGMIIVMLTTSLNPADRDRAEAHQHVGRFQSKPLTEQVLLEIVKTHFDDSMRWKQQIS